MRRQVCDMIRRVTVGDPVSFLGREEHGGRREPTHRRACQRMKVYMYLSSCTERPHTYKQPSGYRM